MRRDELKGRSFVCLEGCGYCCTFQPELSRLEMGRLRARIAPKPLPFIVGEGRMYLQLQNKCGACTLLERRACSQYDLRPQHCRFFPFHVHFGEQPEILLNETCRGVERVEGGDLSAAFDASVMQNTTREDFERQAKEARDTYAEFKRRATRANCWGDADAAARAALDRPDVATRAWLEEAAARAGEAEAADDMHQVALSAFAEPDVSRRPFYLTKDLRWLTFAKVDADTLDVVEMDEKGNLVPAGRIQGLAKWEDQPQLADHLRFLAQRGVFRGAVYALVDDSDYDLTVEQAAWSRLAEMASELALRARICAALGEPSVMEAARFYDATYLDAPTIGGYL